MSRKLEIPKSHALAWPVDLEPADEGGGFLVSFPDWPANMTEGDTREEALAAAADLLETMVSAAMLHGEALPRPSASKRRPLVYLGPMSAAKVRLNEALQQAGISKADLARRLNQTPQQVGRLFDLRRNSHIDQLTAAFEALGKHLVIDVRDAA